MRFYLSVFFILVCVILLLACADQNPEDQKGGGSSSEAAPGPPEVGYITVQPQRITLSNELPGRVKAYRIAEIRPQVGGIIQSRLFREGSFVEKGRQLYQIDPARYEADLQSAKAGLQDGRAKLKNAAALAGRYERLIGAKAISEQVYDNAMADLEQARAAVALAEAAVRTAKINLDYTKVYAPISGYIGPSGVTEGALVTAGQQSALATIRQLDPVYVDLSQSASEARQVQQRIMADRMKGKPETEYRVILLHGSSEEPYPHAGALDAADLFVDPQTGTIRLRSVIPNPDTALLPGMFVRASLELARAMEAIVVPQKSVIIEPDGTNSVWVIGESNQAEKRGVKTGAAYRNNWVIREGLEAGDRVIVEGTMKLRQGTAVAPMPLEKKKDPGHNPDPEGAGKTGLSGKKRS
ncbi:MAG: efflux RND transporter periplasmic adaptor subunit [Desulfobacterales bacterium]|nr:efflux RND transporter periplasmic adaptor subunit [Desulfobacterales bacterium]